MPVVQISRPQPVIVPSLTLELFWLCARTDKSHDRSPLQGDVLERVRSFWGDGAPIGVELLDLARQVGCFEGWDITPLLTLEHVALTVPDDDAFETETADERRRLTRRLARLAREPGLRRRYAALVQELWATIRPELNGRIRPLVERSVRQLQSALTPDHRPTDLLPEGHVARQAAFAGLVAEALQAGQLRVTPSASAGEGQHIVALPGLLTVGLGVRASDSPPSPREDAETVARTLRLLGDPTRLLMLHALAEQPQAVGEIAARVGVGQPTVSVHVRLLRDAGLLKADRDAGRTTYRVRAEQLQEVIRVIQQYIQELMDNEGHP